MYKILVGDCRTQLRTLPDKSINCVVTSPPYWGLRDYNVAEQIGLEQSFPDYIDALRKVFAEVHRVLRDDGTLWLNLGDTYNNSDKWGGGGANTGKHRRAPNGEVASWTAVRRKWDGCGLKPKDLVGIPWRVAFALQADGWYLRQDIIWSKPNPMPESVRDRCTKAHEYLFLLSKNDRYYFDAEAMKEPAVGVERVRKDRFGGNKHDGQTTKHSDGSIFINASVRNRRSVWTVTTQPFKEAHFATFPPALVTPCILAGCPEGGIVLDPFGGAGTTALVAEQLKRHSVLIELNPEYVEIAVKRLNGYERR